MNFMKLATNPVWNDQKHLSKDTQIVKFVIYKIFIDKFLFNILFFISIDLHNC
jgi:hypothetical protein